MIWVIMKTILAGNYELLSYQNVYMYKMALRSVNTIARVLNHISVELAGYQHHDKYGVVGYKSTNQCVALYSEYLIYEVRLSSAAGVCSV